MKSKLALTIALVLGAVAISMELASAAPATGSAAPSSKSFDQMDRTRDGYLTLDEIYLATDGMTGKELMAQMKKVDKNKDHKLDKEEFGSLQLD
jgi:hypothetical protein